MNKLAAAQAEYDLETKTNFGFWLYIMTDCVLFATLFATYAVLHTSTYGGPGARELFSLPYVLFETMVLLTSSFSAGLAMLAVKRRAKSEVLVLLGITFALGALFLGLELSEFHKLIAEGNSFRRSGFLSSYFTLVGTHGLHILSGLLWMAVLMVRIAKKGLTAKTARGLGVFSLFWHFLDIVWIFIFTIVYLFGAINV